MRYDAPKPDSAEARFARARALAHAALVWERWGPALLPGALFLLLYVTLALFGVWEALGDPWRLLGLLVTLGGGAAAAIPHLRRTRTVSLDATLRRVEQDSALEGRPFEALTDTPAAMRADSELWRAHLMRMAAMAGRARARQPRAALARTDRFALRIGAVVVLLLGFAWAGGQGPARIADAFMPGFMEGGGVEPVVDAWLQPPDYTGAPPIFLTGRPDAATVFRAPSGSELTVRVSGVRRPPAARVRDDDGGRRLRFESLQDDVHEAKDVLFTDAELTVRRAGNWTIAASPDRPPLVQFIEAPAPRDNMLAFSYRAVDDYGVERLHLVLSLEDAPEETEEIVIDLGGTAPRDLEGSPALDLTEHRWAGRRAQMRLRAVDALGQEGWSETVTARIPQRIFLSPLARAVAEQRQLLMNETADYAALEDLTPRIPEDAANPPQFWEEDPSRRIDRAPEGVRRTADMLGATLIGAERYFDDYVVYLGLSHARSRIQFAREQAELEDIPPLLWRIALRVEMGDLADAEAALRAAERALLEALARGADPDELSQLFDTFQQAMNRYMEALAREAIEQGRVTQAPDGGGMAGMNMNSIQDLLDAIREASELGDEAGARAALAALTEMLRNMEMQIALGGGGGDGQQRNTPESEAMRNALNDLADMIGDQRELMDDTLQQNGGQQQGQQGQQGEQQGGQAPGGEDGQGQGRAGEPGEQSGQQAGDGQPGDTAGGGRQGMNPSELAGRQGGLADRLDQLGQQMGDGARGGAAGGDPGESGAAGDLLEEARRAMREAEQALRRGDGEAALAAQDEALQSLRDGARQLASEMAEQREDGGEGRTVLDPLGRSAGGVAGTGDNVRIPDEMERQRARDILDELRRRAGERRRPAGELDYLRRLLERF